MRKIFKLARWKKLNRQSTFWKLQQPWSWKNRWEMIGTNSSIHTFLSFLLNCFIFSIKEQSFHQIATKVKKFFRSSSLWNLGMKLTFFTSIKPSSREGYSRFLNHATIGIRGTFEEKCLTAGFETLCMFRWMQSYLLAVKKKQRGLIPRFKAIFM